MRTSWKRISVSHSPENVGTERFDSSSAQLIASSNSLQNLRPSFVRTISRELNVDALAAKVCPVLLSDHTVALFALAGHVGSDQADALSRRVVRKGYILAEPQRYILPAPLLLAIVRGQLTAQSLSSQRVILDRQSRTALADAFQDMVEWGVHNEASDLHINIRNAELESEVRFTVAGRYIAPERFQRIPTRTLLDMLAVAWMEIRGGNGAVFDPLVEQQGSLIKQVGERSVLLRWASLAADSGPSVCLRLLSRGSVAAHLTLAGLGYLPHQIQAIEQAVQTSGGAIVFAGNVGSGKSTTLAVLMSQLPASRKVITIEDPVEYLIPNAVQNSVLRDLEATAHEGYAAKLRTLKRSAMNDVLLGEIRDHETGRAFMDMAGSGVNVYTTTHAPSAAAIGERLASDFIGVSRDFLATPGVLKLLVYQVLLPVLCPQCALPVHARPEHWLRALRNAYGDTIDAVRIRNPQGCGQCQHAQIPQQNGYAGRTVAAEYLEPSQERQLLLSLKQADGLRFLLDQPARHFAEVQAHELPSTALHCAMHKSLLGHIDPQDIEAAFRPFRSFNKASDHGFTDCLRGRS